MCPMNTFGSDIILNVVASVIASAILLGAGYLWGKYKSARSFGRRLEEYDFYPYTATATTSPEFSLNNFRLGMHIPAQPTIDRRATAHLHRRTEQRPHPARAGRAKVYARLFDRLRRQKDRRRPSEYWRTSPASPGSSANHSEFGMRSCSTIWSNPFALARRAREQRHRPELRDGTQNLVIDLKKRQIAHEDKLNYELNIGAESQVRLSD